ncbi:hypothetical protein ABBQ32_008760 [Trebouxia sp. C0010 RCD-2024]
MSNPAALRQKLQSRVSNAAQVAAGPNAATISRILESLGDGTCPYEDVAFFMAPMLKSYYKCCGRLHAFPRIDGAEIRGTQNAEGQAAAELWLYSKDNPYQLLLPRQDMVLVDPGEGVEVESVTGGNSAKFYMLYPIGKRSIGQFLASAVSNLQLHHGKSFAIDCTGIRCSLCCAACSCNVVNVCGVAGRL